MPAPRIWQELATLTQLVSCEHTWDRGGTPLGRLLVAVTQDFLIRASKYDVMEDYLTPMREGGDSDRWREVVLMECIPLGPRLVL